MSDLTIITNNHPRDLLYWHELTDKERAKFDWFNPELDDYEFFRYKGNVYCIADFMHVENTMPFSGLWTGYTSDTFFSGILMRYPKEEWGDYDTEHVVVGWYYS